MEEERWCTPFGRWIQDFGVGQVSEEIGVSRNAVYEWVAGRAKPRPENAETMAELSRGRLTIADIYRHRREVGR